MQARIATPPVERRGITWVALNAHAVTSLSFDPPLTEGTDYEIDRRDGLVRFAAHVEGSEYTATFECDEAGQPKALEAARKRAIDHLKAVADGQVTPDPEIFAKIFLFLLKERPNL